MYCTMYILKATNTQVHFSTYLPFPPGLRLKWTLPPLHVLKFYNYQSGKIVSPLLWLVCHVTPKPYIATFYEEKDCESNQSPGRCWNQSPGRCWNRFFVAQNFPDFSFCLISCIFSVVFSPQI